MIIQSVFLSSTLYLRNYPKGNNMEKLDDDVLIRSELITHTDIKKPASPVGFFMP